MNRPVVRPAAEAVARWVRRRGGQCQLQRLRSPDCGCGHHRDGWHKERPGEFRDTCGCQRQSRGQQPRPRDPLRKPRKGQQREHSHQRDRHVGRDEAPVCEHRRAERRQREGEQARGWPEERAGERVRRQTGCQQQHDHHAAAAHQQPLALVLLEEPRATVLKHVRVVPAGRIGRRHVGVRVQPARARQEHRRSTPDLRQRRMVRREAQIAGLQVHGAGGQMARLVEGATILHKRCDSEDASGGEQHDDAGNVKPLRSAATGK